MSSPSSSPCPSLHIPTTISRPSSFRFAPLAYRDIVVEFLRVASLTRVRAAPANLLLHDAPLSRRYVPPRSSLTVSSSFSRSLLLLPSFFLSFSAVRRLFLSPTLSSSFLVVFSSSFSRFPKSDGTPFVCDVSTLHVLLVARRPETSHSVAPF